MVSALDGGAFGVHCRINGHFSSAFILRIAWNKERCVHGCDEENEQVYDVKQAAAEPQAQSLEAKRED